MSANVKFISHPDDSLTDFFLLVEIRQSVVTLLPPAVYRIDIQPLLFHRIIAKFRYIRTNKSHIFTFDSRSGLFTQGRKPHQQ
jgi:hypothetical protein